MALEIKQHEIDWLQTGTEDHRILAEFLTEMVLGQVFADNAAVQAVLAKWSEFYEGKKGTKPNLFKDVWVTKDDQRILTDGGMTPLQLAILGEAASTN